MPAKKSMVAGFRQPTMSSIRRAMGNEVPKIIYEFPTGDKSGAVVVKTYKWDHDGPFNKDDYEPVVYFFSSRGKRPRHAIAFSHYGYVYHKNVRVRDKSRFSPHFPTSFHTPILRAGKVKVKGGIMAKATHAEAFLEDTVRPLSIIEKPSLIHNGKTPASAQISVEVDKILNNMRRYRNELEGL